MNGRQEQFTKVRSRAAGKIPIYLGDAAIPTPHPIAPGEPRPKSFTRLSLCHLVAGGTMLLTILAADSAFSEMQPLSAQTDEAKGLESPQISCPGDLAGSSVANPRTRHKVQLSQATRDYRRPFGPRAPWNVPVAELPRHPQSDLYAARFWNDATERPGNINLSFDGYTYPVYHASDATGQFQVRTRYKTNIDGTKIPWNPRWKPASGRDGQVIVLDRKSGREWDLWQVSFENQTIHATNGSLVAGDYRTKEDGNKPSRGIGIQYLAMLVRPQEIAEGEIRHALSMTARNTDGELFVAPATKLEFPDHPSNGVPEGMRFALDISLAEIDAWAASLPRSLPPATRESARVIARALRDYGWFITDTSGSAHLQFEDRLTAERHWIELGLGHRNFGGKVLPRDLLDGLLSRQRIYALVPSDQYPSHLSAR